MSKYFNFENKSDYIYYLSEIIIDTIQKKERLEFYLGEIITLLETNPNAKLINSKLYESISDKTIRPLQYLSNLIGDESKKAVSYRKFRKILFKNRNDLKIKIDNLSTEEEKLLGEFNQLRNWGLHIPESLFLQKKIFFKMDENYILENKAQIIIPRYDNFEIKFLQQYKEELSDFLSSTEIILSRMKRDYEQLIEEKFEFVFEDNIYKPYKIMDIAQNSWDIQNGKKIKIK